jgi:hypothetical protein
MRPSTAFIGVSAFHRHQLTLIPTSLCRRMDLTHRPASALLRPSSSAPPAAKAIAFFGFFCCFYFYVPCVTWVIGPKILDPWPTIHFL